MVQEQLWQKLSLLMEKFRLSLVAVWHVQRVLAKKRDPLTHVLFIDESLDDDTLLPSEQIWYSSPSVKICEQYRLSHVLPAAPSLQLPACTLQSLTCNANRSSHCLSAFWRHSINTHSINMQT